MPAVSSTYIFRQLVDGASNTYTYLLADAHTKEAVLIDPVLEQVEDGAEIHRAQKQQYNALAHLKDTPQLFQSSTVNLQQYCW